MGRKQYLHHSCWFEPAVTSTYDRIKHRFSQKKITHPFRDDNINCKSYRHKHFKAIKGYTKAHQPTFNNSYKVFYEQYATAIVAATSRFCVNHQTSPKP